MIGIVGGILIGRVIERFRQGKQANKWFIIIGMILITLDGLFNMQEVMVLL